MDDVREPPLNLLLFVVDGLRADHLSSYGYARATTPVVDRLAAGGVRATRAFASAPDTLAAHASLFTGLYAVTHGATSEHPMLSGAVPTLAGLAKAAGYRTAAFCTHPDVSVETGLGRGFDAFSTQRYRYRLATRAARLSRRAADRLLRRTDAGGRRTVNALKRWLSAAPQPFFAFVHFDEPRFPAKLSPLYQNVFATPAAAGDERRQQIDRYDAAIRYVDERIGEVIDFLAATGDLDRTLVVVTAAHGARPGDSPALPPSGDLHHDKLQIPLIARGPRVVPQGFVIDALVQSTDIAPTMLALAGVPYDAARMHGQAFVQDGRVVWPRQFALAECYRDESAAPEVDRRSKAIWTAREKYVWRSDESNEYYDLVADPAERSNRVDAAADRSDALRRQLFDWLAGVDMFEAQQSGDIAARAM